MSLFNSFSQNLFGLLKEFENPKITLGLSGGLDSMVLLDLLHKYSLNNSAINLTAVYINHQLQADSDSWAEFNARVCREYNIPYTVHQVMVDKTSGLGLEGEARLQRYKIFKSFLSESQSILATAHHLNDQAETVLLQLMRAAGPKGLSAMPSIKKLANGWHMRPLLNISRADLLIYARSNNLTWVEDKTNQDNDLDRNYLRNVIIPQLEERWPHAVKSLANTAQHCANHENLLNNYIKADYQHCLVGNKQYGCIDITKFNSYDTLKQHAVLRYWFGESGLRSPGPKKISEIIKTVINARIDAKPKYVVENKIITRHKKHLYLLNLLNELEVSEPL